jgi:cyclophilin family peptidyl-prolyl cis-trans isomerase
MTAPTVTFSDNLPGIANRSTGSLRFTLNFSEAVTGLEASDLGVSNGTLLSVDAGADSSTYTVSVSPALGVASGKIGLILKAGAVTDASGNQNLAASNSAQAIDTVAPAAPKPVPLLGFDNPQVTIQTSMGTMVAELYPTQAPITVANMLAYANAGFYSGTLFHRVIPGFMDQGGGYTASGYKTPTYAAITLESNNGLSNLRGTLAMARTAVADSATSQFFINQVDNLFLNYSSTASPGYAVFGKVLAGLDVVDSIAEVPRSSSDKPLTDITITSLQQTATGSTQLASSSSLSVSGLEAGAVWSYSLNGGITWLAGSGTNLALPAASYAANTIQIKQTDAAGNTSTGSFSSALTYKTAALVSADLLAYSWKTHTLLDDVSLSNGSFSQATTANGAASLEAIKGQALSLTASRAIPSAEATATSAAVNLQDAIAILKMIVGLEVNGTGKALSPYQALAADYDGNGRVELTDAIGVLKHVVGLTAPDPAWRFVNELDTTVPSKTTLSPGLAQTSITASLSASSPVKVGLVGYLTGDVDGSYALGGSSSLTKTYFDTLVAAHPTELSLAQFGVY